MGRPYKPTMHTKPHECQGWVKTVAEQIRCSSKENYRRICDSSEQNFQDPAMLSAHHSEFAQPYSQAASPTPFHSVLQSQGRSYKIRRSSLVLHVSRHGYPVLDCG